MVGVWRLKLKRRKLKKRLCVQWLGCRMLNGVVSRDRMRRYSFHPQEGARYWCPHYGPHDTEVDTPLNKCDAHGEKKCIFHGPVCIEVEVEEDSGVV